jgi:hypothetical protein
MNARYNATVSMPKMAADTLVRTIVEDGLLGVAVLSGSRHVHVAANAKYERLVGTSLTYGRPLRDVLDTSIVPEVVLAGVLDGSGPVSVREVVRKGDVSLDPQRATFMFYRVDEDPTSLLVIAHDVTEVVRARNRQRLFSSLTSELLSSVEPRAAVRSVVTQAERALGACTSSVFVIDGDGRTLRGGEHEWDWTRTSFGASLDDWPTVDAILASGSARFITLAEATSSERGWFEARGIVATLCVPLRAHGAPIGVIFFDFDAARPLPIANVDFASDIAAQCAAALDRALDAPARMSAPPMTRAAELATH